MFTPAQLARIRRLLQIELAELCYQRAQAAHAFSAGHPRVGELTAEIAAVEGTVRALNTTAQQVAA